jgi:hypothetical protein
MLAAAVSVVTARTSLHFPLVFTRGSSAFPLGWVFALPGGLAHKILLQPIVTVVRFKK